MWVVLMIVVLHMDKNIVFKVINYFVDKTTLFKKMISN